MPIDPTDPTVVDTQSNAIQAILWGGVLLLAVLVLGVFLLVMRRKMLAEAESSSAFSIEDLEAMRKSGHLSDEEFRQLRTVAMGVALPIAEKPQAASEETEENDGNCPLSGAGPADDS